MAELKTTRNDASVSAFLNAIPDPQRRNDAKAVAAMLASITGEKPKMWGSSIVGYGTQHYKYASGREGDWFRAGFSPRKGSLTIYVTSGFDRHKALMAKLGKYTTGVSCLYLKRLSDVDQQVLEQLVTESLNMPLPGADPVEKRSTRATAAGARGAKRQSPRPSAAASKPRARARG
jgi:hypothetical protein